MVSIPYLPYLESTIELSDGVSFRRLQSITDFREVHDGFPIEKRILYLCKRTDSTTDDDGKDCIVKIKVQVPNEGRDSITPQREPSNITTAELKALQLFRDGNSLYGPQLIGFKTSVQGGDGPMPGGYITYTIMTKLPGQSLLGLGYWSMTFEERQQVQQAFLEALAGVRRLGIEPGDKGLRNIIWDSATKRCTLVDFELWSPYSGLAGDETEELQKWGLAHRPPAKNWWAEFGIKTM